MGDAWQLADLACEPRFGDAVTGNVDGKSIVQSDEALRAYEFKTIPGYDHTLIWVNPATPDLSTEQRFDSYPDSVVPGWLGASRSLITRSMFFSSAVRTACTSSIVL
jgi:hypothetical protein